MVFLQPEKEGSLFEFESFILLKVNIHDSFELLEDCLNMLRHSRFEGGDFLKFFSESF